MKTSHRLFASLVTLLAACILQAADPISRVIAITEIETDDPIAYATWIKQTNEIAKAKLGIDNYLRVYQSTYDGRTTGRVRAVAAASSAAELLKYAQALENDPAIIQNRAHLRGIRTMGARVLYRSVRFEGPNPRGSHNFNSLLQVTDEAGYLGAINGLRAIFDGNGFKDARISVNRVVAGRTDHSHRVTIAFPSGDRLAAFLDFTATSPIAREWITNAARYRTVVADSTSREITQYSEPVMAPRPSTE